MVSTSPASIPATRTFAPFSRPAIWANSAYTSIVSANIIRRSPIRNSPTAKSNTPPSTNAPTTASFFFDIRSVQSTLSGILGGHERAHGLVVVLFEFSRCPSRDNASFMQHQEFIADVAGTWNVVRHHDERRSAGALESRQQIVDLP